MHKGPRSHFSMWRPMLGVVFLGLLVVPDIALAGYLSEISASFSSSARKEKQLEALCLYIGILFLLLALLQLVQKRELLLRLIGPIVTLLLGSALILMRYT